MKKSIKLVTLLSILLFFSNHTLGQKKGQKNTQTKKSQMILNKTIRLDGNSIIQKIKIKVSDDIIHIQIGVNSVIKSGSLAVEIYNPKGIKKGDFLLESQLTYNDNNKELVSGQMQKKVKNPINGYWIIKLIPIDAIGDISIYTLKEKYIY